MSTKYIRALLVNYCDYMIAHNNIFFRLLSSYVDSVIDYEQASISILDCIDIKKETKDTINNLVNIILTDVKYDETSEFHSKYSLLFVYKYFGLFYEYCEKHYRDNKENIDNIANDLNNISDNKLTVRVEYYEKLPFTRGDYAYLDIIVFIDGFDFDKIPCYSTARNKTIKYLQKLECLK